MESNWKNSPLRERTRKLEVINAGKRRALKAGKYNLYRLEEIYID